jgi:germination protein M
MAIHNNTIKRLTMAVLAVAAAALMVQMTGCGKKGDVSGYFIEYLNIDRTKLISVGYTPVADDVEGLIKEFLVALSSDPDAGDYRKPIPSNVEVTGYSLDGVLLSLHFDEDYSAMTPVEEVLCRAAVVRTMTQIDGIDCVCFYVGDTPLVDNTGAVIGNMYQESFIENPGEQINSIQDTSLTLYFANEDGDALVKETRADVYYSSNVSLEKLVMEQLLEGPKADGAISALPEGTRLVNVSVADGVCYVSLDDTFKNQDYRINEAIVIYSIVDSLTELPSVGKVQISVNGDTSGVYRDSYSLSNTYERNLDYVAGEEGIAATESLE